MFSVDATTAPDGMPIPPEPPEATADHPAPPRRTLRRAAETALVESRERWRELTGLAADLAFETDATGRLSFLAPEDVLGWPAAALLGRRPAEAGLLREPGPDPFALRQAARDLRTWVRRADGAPACLSVSVRPMLCSAGSFAGLRGTARDITAEAAEAEAQAAALRRALAVQTLVRRVREAVLAPRMLPALLALLPPAIGCAGAVLVELDEVGLPATPVGPALDPSALGPPPQGEPRFLAGAAGEKVALVPQAGRGLAGERPQALLVWRAAGERPFDADERHLLQALSDLLGVVLGNQHLLMELERQARTDGMTGLLNRRAFLEELHRRQERGRRAGQGGALLFIDVDRLKPVNDRFGHEAGDALLLAVAGLLRRSIRAIDLAARFGGDEFALWLEGVADPSVASARAQALCTEAAAIALRAPGCGTTVPVRISLGVAPGAAGEDPEALLARADAALYAAKRAGRNAWRLAE